MTKLHNKAGLLGSLIVGLTISLSSCNKVDNVYDPNADPNPGNGTQKEVKEPNTFNFSTVQKVTLSVDYSEFKVHGPVFFGLYTENPIITVEDAPEDKWNEKVTPIYEDYTDANGRFNATIELPAYAKHLFIATGNFFTGMQVMEADVLNGVASAKAKNENTVGKSARRRAEGPGESTNDLSTLNLTNLVDQNGNVTSTQMYNEWKNWLGTWNSASGRPDYLLDRASANPKLVFSDAELEGLYAAVGSAFVSGSAMNNEYCSSPDLLLEKDSEVTFTLLGGSTCWNSSLGYYYYTDNNKPTQFTDIHPVMVFPNTQDGEWANAKLRNLRSYRGNIGTYRGDVVQLVYYPHIANNDMSDATTVFPKGTRIGFVLKTQAWSMQGLEYSNDIGKFSGLKPYNMWCTTTEGLSYGVHLPGDQGTMPNLTGQSRGAKFSYTSAGNTYTLVSFEDGLDDEDFDDLFFALKPVGVFSHVPEIEPKKSSSFGVYAFEDLWPAEGDYDMNDCVVEVKHEKEFNDKGKIVKETFYLTTYQNYVELTSGLALTLEPQVTPSSITTLVKRKGSTVAEEATFQKDGNVYYLTSDFKGELGSTYILQLNYASPLASSEKVAAIKPFIFREEEGGTWEVHIPFEAPTARMKQTTYFGKDQDCSTPFTGPYFVRRGNYPFAFYLKGVDISAFENTILKRVNEKKRIDLFFPHFLDWAESKGTDYLDWYVK